MLEQDTAVASDIHPLSPLTPNEIEAGAQLIKSQLGEKAAFCSVRLVEPAKSFLHSYASGDKYARILRFDGTDYPTKDALDGGFNATVNLTTGEVAIDRIANGQAPIGFVDYMTAVEITKSDPGWQEAVRKRGIQDFTHVQLDPWPAGGYQHPSIPQGHRANRAIAFHREDGSDNGYAHPIQGLIAHVDLTEGKVAHLEDHGVVPIPTESGRYTNQDFKQLREAPKTISITQPDGPGFTVRGNAIKWQNWQFRVTVHPVHGLVLHQLGYEDQGSIRSVLHRAALSDMVVPYGDTDPMHSWKHVLDAGEASLGNCVNSLNRGCDCLGEIHYLDHVCVKPDGTARLVERAICIHEEDYGVLWKHYNGHSKSDEVRRSRRLVVSTFHTVGNYEYGFYWYLYLDGTIQMEVKLTGIVGVSAIADGEERSEFAPLVAPNVASPIHQHLFCFRLDFELDGTMNSVYEVNTEAEPISEVNPDGTAFAARATLLRTESDAKRNADTTKARSWKVVNDQVKNRLGNSVGYRLSPHAIQTMFAREGSQMAKRAGFAKHNLWVTPYDDSELCAAGEYPHLGEGDGLPFWTEQDRNIEKTDIVLWHTCGVTHVPRPEDWPVMPVEYTGFTLHPVGFFDRNPAINLPGHAKHQV
ncbi:MAG: primary-amine oxidase [Gammaproteobacteria bacterium]|nr:primary-amine oxidase [Gammaproteobacteria bacterium]